METRITNGLKDVIQIGIFLLVVLVIYWSAGERVAYWLLLVILLGQVMGHWQEISDLIREGVQ